MQLNTEVNLTTICKSCVTTLETFHKLHLVATSSQKLIIEALSQLHSESNQEDLSTLNEEIVIEFLNVDKQLECIEEDVASVHYSRDSTPEPEQSSSEEKVKENNKGINLQCNFCSRTYKRKVHLERHIAKQHQDGVVKSIQKTKLLAVVCDLCGKKFQNRRNYENHMREITCVPDDLPECRFCREEFANVSELQDHILLNHPKGREYNCQICFKSFSTVSNRNSHVQSHNADDSVKCSICNQGFKSILYLKKHQKAIHTKVENTCHLCDRKFDTQQKFDYHLKTHDSVKRYKCDHPGCDKSFMQYHHRENHKTTHTGVSKYLCFKCGKEFRQECNLKAHLKIHDNDNKKSFKCTFHDCEKSFKLNSSLRCHKKIHEKDKNTSQCPECGKKFSQRSSFRTHFQTHFRDPENRPFKCNQPGCERSFYQERSIKYHKSTAHGIGEPIVKKELPSSYVCDFCQKSFKLQSLLKQHILIHIEVEQQNRKHKCDKCEASFKRPEHLKLHINSVHLKYKPYQCEHSGCEKSFAQIGDRNVHMKIHLDEKPHVCSICQKAFRLAKGLRAHMKIHSSKNHENKSIEVLVDVDTKDQNEAEIIYEALHPSTQIVFLLTPVQQ